MGGGGRGTPTLLSRSSSSLLPVIYADTRCIGAVISQANAAKAESLGVGVKVDRPAKSRPSASSDAKGEESDEGGASVYAAEVAAAVQQVMGAAHQTLLNTASGIARELQKAGGVATAVQIVSEAASRKTV